MDPDTPDTEHPFRLADMAGPPRRRTGLIIGAAIAVACLAGAVIAVVVLSGRQPQTSAAGQRAEALPSPDIIPTAISLTPTSAIDSASPTAAASALRSPSQTCSDSAGWEQDGGTELIDAYINNQDSGNINVEDIKAECPQYLPVWKRAQGGIPDGSSFAVPADVKPGTYETTSSDLENCYWERSRQGRIVDNRFITASRAKQRVTIRATDDTFVTKDCGNWVKVD